MSDDQWKSRRNVPSELTELRRPQRGIEASVSKTLQSDGRDAGPISAGHPRLIAHPLDFAPVGLGAAPVISPPGGLPDDGPIEFVATSLPTGGVGRRRQWSVI